MSEQIRPRVLLIRGHQTNSWHLRPWRYLTDRYDIVVAQTRRTWFDTSSLGLATIEAPALRDLLPPGRIGHELTRIPGDRYLKPRRLFRGFDIVHSQDLGFWYSMQAAKYRRELGHKLVLTVWETIPFIDAYRNIRTRPYRRRVLAETDLFLPTTERARAALLLEGAEPERIELCPPGIDDEFLRAGAGPSAGEEPGGHDDKHRTAGRETTSAGESGGQHLILSAGRLVWEKGHQDVLRAVAAIKRGLVEHQLAQPPRVLVVGRGPEERRLKRYARELGIGELVEVRREVPYAEMPALYRRASCLVLASLPIWSWEEQFGMVMAEAACVGLAIAAARSGAIPEVAPRGALLFDPGDWLTLAQLLVQGPLSREPGARVSYPREQVDRYSGRAFAERLDRAYQRALGGFLGSSAARSNRAEPELERTRCGSC